MQTEKVLLVDIPPLIYVPGPYTPKVREKHDS